jgi:L,D-peptidoglycan transpeptidase YkuD (ErfK/YbiS/YcfS/YnhG family)
LIERGRGGGAAVAVAVAIAGCGSAETRSVPSAGSAMEPAKRAGSDGAAAAAAPSPAAPANTAASEAATRPTAGGSAGAAAAAVIPADARQLVTAVVDDWGATRATLRRFRRAGARWEPDGEPWLGVVGKSGAAWGAGLHGAGAPAGRGGPVKHEGDNKSPAGAFALRGSYGYAKAPPSGTRLPYVAVDERWQCVDDPESTHYDQILDRTTVAPDWKSFEDMRRKDELYRWVVDVAHNPARDPGAGSCIFLHVWRGERAGTAGCTAMDEQKLARLLATLDPSAVFVLLPRAEYEALAPDWALPALVAAAPR